MKTYQILILSLFLTAIVFMGCDLSDSVSSAPNGGFGGRGDMGVTPGGAQDMSLIRELIDQGTVPDPDNFYMEGIFSEYDLPIEGAPADKVLTIRTSHCYSPQNQLPGDGVYVQVGMSSSISPETFSRDPLNLSVVVDRSGSMTGGKIVAVKQALKVLIDQLDEQDILSIVLFSSEMSVLFSPRSVNNPDQLKDYIDLIEAGGSTNIDAGLRQGYDFVRQNREAGEERSDRVMLFTDALPNTGDTSPDNFKSMVGEAAQEYIGLTAFGVGIDFDQDLINYFATQRGCNYFYLQDEDKIGTVFNQDFDYLVTPIAYDLNLHVDFGTGFRAATGYGFPPSEGEGVGFDVASVFLSRNRGALMLRFLPKDGGILVSNGQHIADVSLDYKDRDGEVISEFLQVNYSGANVDNPEAEYYEQYGVHLASVLVREILALKEVCDQYRNGDKQEAVNLLNELDIWIKNQNQEIGDNILSVEIAMIAQLKQIIDAEPLE